MFIISLLLAAALVMSGIWPSYASELQKFSNAHWVDDSYNDGDSFLANVDGRRLHIRLYFVDCPETLVGSKADAERVQEQTRYYGLTSPAHTIHFGKEARTFVAQALTKPFTVHTAFAKAPGRSAEGRVYAFVTTADGYDLATLLAKNGLARTYGIGRKTPDGKEREEMVAELRDLEAAAMLRRVGVWAQSDPEQLAELRTAQRAEERELQTIREQATDAKPGQQSLDLNTATEEQLQSVAGIGPVLAARIVAGRPYRGLDDLLKVKGIGSKKLEQFQPYFLVGTQ